MRMSSLKRLLLCTLTMLLLLMKDGITIETNSTTLTATIATHATDTQNDCNDTNNRNDQDQKSKGHDCKHDHYECNHRTICHQLRDVPREIIMPCTLILAIE